MRSPILAGIVPLPHTGPHTSPDPTRASQALSLRQATRDDVPYLAALAADPQVEPFLSFGAAHEDRLRALIAAPGPAPGSGGLLVIESRDSHELLGGLGLTVVNARSRISDLSRVMVRPD